MHYKDKFLKICRRCTTRWVLGTCLVIAAVLATLVPIVGIPTLIAFLPLVICIGMCALMPFMMRSMDSNSSHDNENTG